MIGDHEERLTRVGRALAEIAHTLELTDDVEERMARVLQLAGDVVPYARITLLEERPDGTQLLTTCPELDAAGRQRLAAVTGRLARLVAGGEGIGRGAAGGEHLTLPVTGLDEVLGVLRAEPPGGVVYGATHLRLLSVIAAQLGSYLTMIRLRDDDARRVRELAAAHDFQQLLMGVVSHDLRNPLATITMVATLLLSRARDPEQARTLERALRNAKLAARIIDDLVDVTQARVKNTLPVVRRRIDLNALVESLVADLRLVHPGRHLVLRLGGAGPAMGDWDADRVTQIATNLLTNALHHGRQDGVVTLTVGLTDDEASLAVHNDGAAIPAAELPLLFDPFRQAPRDPRLVRERGLGLGLYIVEQAALAHGGSATVASSDAAGTTFTVRLPRWHGTSPRVRSVAAVAAPVDAAGTAAAGAVVMIVDDDPDVVWGLEELLRVQGHEVVTASNGREALDVLGTGVRPGLILLDLHMPVMDGETFQAVLQADASLSRIPLVIISSDTQRALRLQRQGARACLAKPVRRDDLLQAVAHWTH